MNKDRAFTWVVAPLACALGAVLALGKIIKYRLCDYTADGYVALEMARNNYELKRFMTSTTYGNFLGAHLYLLNPFEAVPVAWLGGLYYMLIAGVILAGATMALYKIALVRARSTLLATLMALSFAVNPLTWGILDMEVFGFQYDLYALLLLPLLIWSILRARTWIFALVLFLTLLVKEEIAMSVPLVGGYFICWPAYRRRGWITAGTGVAAFLLAMLTLRHFAPESYQHTTFDVTKKLLDEGGLLASLKTLALPRGNCLLDFASRCNLITGPVIYLLLVASAWPMLPLSIFTSVLYQHDFLRLSLIYWKTPYLWACAWCFAALNMGYLMQRGQLWRHAVRALAGLAAIWSVVLFSQWLRAHPHYHPVNSWRMLNDDIEHLLVPSQRPLAEYRRRAEDIKQIEEKVGPAGIVIFINQPQSPIGELSGRAHAKQLAGANFILMDTMTPQWNDLPPTAASFAYLPVAFQSPRFTLLALSVIPLEAAPAETSREAHAEFTAFDIEVKTAGTYAVEIAYTLAIVDGKHFTGYPAVAWQLDGVVQTTGVMQIGTIGATAVDAARMYCGDHKLTPGRHRLTFPSPPGQVVYHIYMRAVGAS